ncbi:tail protein [Vibrio phage PS15B-5]
MSLSPNEKYPGATEADPNYKDGKFKDNNPSTTNNGSPLKAVDRNEQLALQEAVMDAAGFEYNGTVDTPENSQMFAAYKAALSNGANLLSNHNFLTPSPDDSQPAPSATPTSYPPGYQIFSGVFANETSGISNLTYIDGHVSFSGGDFYMPVANTGGLERLTEFVASVADFDGKPRTRGVSFSLVGDEYRVTVSIDALEDVSATLTPLGSVKFEQGSVATVHEVGSLSVGNLSDYTYIAYKAYGGNSAVDNMIAGVPVAAETDDLVKCENGSEFKRIAVTGSLSDFEPVGEVYLADFGDDTQAFQDAANCGSLALNLPESISITEQVVLPPNVSLISKAVKAVIDTTGITTTNVNAIVQSGSISNSTTLISDVTDKSITITVNDPTGFEPGKVIFVRSTLDNSWSGTWGSANRTYRKKSSFIVTGVSGNIILLDTETNTTFEMASTVVEVLEPTTATHKNFVLKGPDNNQSRGMQVQYGYGTIFEDVDTDGFEITGLENLNCRLTKYIRPKGNIRAAAVNTQYTIAVSGSDLTEIIDGDLASTRHAVAIVGNDQCRRTTVKKSILKGSFPADAHGNADDYTYEENEIYSTSGGLKVGGRNGSWIRNKVFSENATIIAGIEIYGGTFRFYDNEFYSPSDSTFGAGWSPIDLGRGTAAITTDSRQDMLFKFYDNNVDLPGNIGSFYARVQNNSPYKVNMKFKSEDVRYPTAIDSFFRYEGTPTGGDANFATFDDIYFETTAPSLPLIKRGTGATGYNTSKVVSADYSALSS